MKNLRFVLPLLFSAIVGNAAATTIYMTGSGQDLYAVNSTNGSGQLIGAFGSNLTSTYTLSFQSSGKLYGIDAGSGWTNGVLETINTSTGAATTIGTGTGISDLMAMAFGPSGTLYAASWATNDLYTINANTGVASLVGALDFSGIMDLAFDTNGNLYGINSTGLYEVNQNTGAGALVTDTTSNSCLMALGVDGSNNFYTTDYCSSNTPLYLLNTTNGNLTSIGSTGIASAMGAAIAPTNVPEPAGVALLGMGLIGLVAARRRRSIVPADRALPSAV